MLERRPMSPPRRKRRRGDETHLEAETARRIQLLVAQADVWSAGTPGPAPVTAPIESAAS